MHLRRSNRDFGFLLLSDNYGRRRPADATWGENHRSSFRPTLLSAANSGAAASRQRSRSLRNDRRRSPAAHYESFLVRHSIRLRSALAELSSNWQTAIAL